MFIVFDIGGTNTRIALSRDGSNLEAPVIYPTPHDFAEGIDKFVSIVQQLTNNTPITAIAGGVPGPMDKAHTQLIKAPNLPDWNNKPLQEMLEKRLNTTVYLENDTAMWGLGEASIGAGKDKNICAYITVSTGVGGCRIVNGNIDISVFGFEPGHQIIDPNGPLCGCGGIGHLEAFTSGTALQKKHGVHPQDIHDEAVWENSARYLAIGLLNTSVFWSPDIIVLGGSVMKDISLEQVRHYMKSLNTILLQLPELSRSTLGDIGGLSGSLRYLRLKRNIERQDS